VGKQIVLNTELRFYHEFDLQEKFRAVRKLILIDIKCNILYETKNISDISNTKVSALHDSFIPVFDYTYSSK
jgi:hypothetical protein